MKILKYLLIGIAVIFLTLFLVLRIGYHEKRPSIKEGQSAEALASKMLQAVNQSAWDTLNYISWTFRGENHYVWDRENNTALVQWGDIKVHLDPDQVSGKVYKNDVEVEGKDADKHVKKAWSNWCNDMFWLAAPFKIKDPGTSLSVAEDNEGKEGLLVTYESGGVTPGDSYLWFLDSAGLPTGYKMWVKIIPVGGVYTSWESWKEIEGGSKIAQVHQGNIKALRIEITNLKAGDSWEDLGYQKSPILL